VVSLVEMVKIVRIPYIKESS